MSDRRKGVEPPCAGGPPERPAPPFRSLLLAVLLILAAQAAAADPSLSAPSRVTQGDTITILVADAQGVTSGVAEVADPAGAIIDRAPLFPLPAAAAAGVPDAGARQEASTDARWAALLGIPSDLPPGGYTLRISTELAGGSLQLARTLTVEAGRFAREEIPLNAALSELREAPSPEKEAQAREFWKIITTFNLRDVFQEGPLRDPLTKWIVTAPFGEHRVYLYSNGRTSAEVHYGIDMAAPLGTPIFAAGSGRVVFAGAWLLTGNTVVVEHLPGVYSSYFHMSKILVKAGEMVAEGQEIGEVGETGLATGPHLHWQITVAGVPVSPDQLVHAPLIDKSSRPATMGDQRPEKGGDFHRLREN